MASANQSPASRGLLRPLLLALIFIPIFYRFLNHSIIFRDSFYYFAPAKFLISEALKARTVYAWNPWQLLGLPFAADIQAGWFYPLNAIYLLLPFEPAHRLFILIHYPFAALFMYLFLRGRGIDRDAAFLAGLGFPLCGYMISQHGNLAFLIGPAWAPLAFYFLDRARRGSWAWAPAAGAALSMQILGGEPQSAAVTASLLTLDTLWRLRASPRRRVALTFAFAGASAFLFSAVQILPTYDLLQQSVRKGGLPLAEASAYSFNPQRLPELVWPNFSGTVWPEVTGFGPALADAPAAISTIPWSYTNYLGLPLAALAVAGLLASKQRARLAVAGAMAFFLLAAFGHFTPVFGWLHHLPVFNWFRYPEKYLAWFSAFTVVAAALGLGTIKEWAETRPDLLFKAALGYLALAVVLAALGISGTRPALSAVQPLAVSLAAGGVMILIAKKILSWPRGIAILFAVLVLDFELANVATMPAGPPDVYRQLPLAARKIIADGRSAPGLFRIMRRDIDFRNTNPALASAPRLERQALWERDTLKRNVGAMAGLQDLVGESPYTLPAGLALLAHLTPAVAELYNVRYVISSYGSAPFTSVRAEKIYEDPVHDLTITRLPDAWPRAYWVPKAIAAANEAEALALMSRTDLRKTVIITSTQPLPANGPPDRELIPARIIRYTPNYLWVEVIADTAGWLVLSDRFYPGWEAKVDLYPATIYPANLMVRAVHLEPGRRLVIFHFRPWTLKWGGLISFCAWALALSFWTKVVGFRV